MACSTTFDGHMGGDVGMAFRRKHESGDGEPRTMNDCVGCGWSFDLRKCPFTGQIVSDYGYGVVSDSSVIVV